MQIVLAGGCTTAKVKVAERGQTLADDVARLEAVRDALGPGGLVRVDANGGWDLDEAVRAIMLLERAAGGLEYVEQPCATVEELAAVRRAVGRARSPRTSRSGGPRTPTACATSRPPTSRCSRCSRSAACGPACGSPRTSGCRSWCRARSSRASASPPAWLSRPRCRHLEHACGLATVQLLSDDVAVEPLLPVDGFLPVPPVVLDEAALARLAAPPRPDRPLGAPARRRTAGSATMTDATELARGVVALLMGHGVTEIVLAPGSRNAPLAFAAYDAAEAGAVRLHTRIDERAAGFLALGLTKVGRRAAVVCTSGTAVANLHPAALEAWHAGLPVIFVTADRPLRLRGTSANQTTDQVGHAAEAAVPRHRRGRRAARGRWARSDRGTSTSSSTTRWSAAGRWDVPEIAPTDRPRVRARRGGDPARSPDGRGRR